MTWSDHVDSLLGIPLSFTDNSITHLKSLIHADDVQSWERRIQQSVAKGSVHDCVFRIINTEGETRWCHTYGGAKRDAEGRTLYLAGHLRDITREREAELQLKKTLNELQLAVDTAKLGIWRFYLDSGTLEWNDTLHAIYGVSKTEFQRDIDAWRHRVLPEDLAEADARFAEIMEGKSVYDVEFRVRQDDDTVSFIQASGAPMFDEKGKIVELVGINLDISNIRRREQTLAEAASVFDNTIEGIIMTDLSGVITQVNPAFETITGYKREQVIGQNCNILRSGKHDEAFYEDMWSCLLNEGHWKGEIYNRKQCGTLFPE